MKLKNLIRLVLITFLLLLIPFIAMQFSSEVNWTFFDFAVACVLLLVTGILLDFAFRKIARQKYRIIIVLAVILVFLLIWAELAVGIFGTPFGGN